jgi:predicted glycosyltransferase
MVGDTMRIWYDACTGKHVRYGSAITRRLRRAGHEVVFTTREHPDTVHLAESLGEEPIVVGKYDPTSLSTRLEESSNRVIEFSRMFKKEKPDVAVSSQSVELCRAAFGLGIPIVLTADTPHAAAVNRLTVPLASILITSEAIPKSLFEGYGAQKVVHFKGVDEVSWIKGYKQKVTFGYQRPLIIVRQIETGAAYAVGKNDMTVELARKLSSLGHVLFLPRYGKLKDDRFMIAEDFVDSAGLAAYADLVVSVGGTLAREAALLGTPSIVINEFERIEVNDYLAKKGFPIFTVDSSTVLEFARRYLGKKFDVEAGLSRLENPVDLIEKIIMKKTFG